MNFYILFTTGDFTNEDLCVIEGVPEEVDLYNYKLCFGKPIADEYPEGAKIYLTEEQPGTEVSDIVSNTDSNFIVKKKVKKIIETECADLTIEYLPFTLINHENEPYPDTLYFINPIGSFDCLDLEASGAEFDDDGEVEDLEELVLSKDKIANAPHFFRVPEERTAYIISQHLLNQLKENGISNLEVKELFIV